MTFSSKAIAACALMILLGIGVLSYWSTVRDEADRGWVTHTHVLLEKLQPVLIDITQAETSQRGYILTGEEKYAEPYQAGLDRVHRDIAKVRKLTADNRGQQEAIEGLKPQVDAMLAGLSGKMEIRRRVGLMGAAEAVTKGNTEELMNGIRERIDEMRSTEERLLKVRLETA